MISKWFRRMSAKKKRKRKRRHSKNRRSLSVESDRHRMDSSRVLEWRSPVDGDSNEETGLEQPWSSHRERTDWWDYCFERVPIDSNWTHHWSRSELMVVYSDSQLLLPVDQRAMERNSSATHCCSRNSHCSDGEPSSSWGRRRPVDSSQVYSKERRTDRSTMDDHCWYWLSQSRRVCSSRAWEEEQVRLLQELKDRDESVNRERRISSNLSYSMEDSCNGLLEWMVNHSVSRKSVVGKHQMILDWDHLSAAKHCGWMHPNPCPSAGDARCAWWFSMSTHSMRSLIDMEWVLWTKTE